MPVEPSDAVPEEKLQDASGTESQHYVKEEAKAESEETLEGLALALESEETPIPDPASSEAVPSTSKPE